MSEIRYLAGFKPVLEMLGEYPDRILKIFCKKDKKGLAPVIELAEKYAIPTEFLSEQEFAKIPCGNARQSTQGVVAHLAPVPLHPLEAMWKLLPQAPLPLLLALDQVQDAGNVGALARTAWALGAGGMLLPKHNSTGLSNTGVARASAGAIARLPLCIVTNLARSLDAADEQGFTIVGTACRENGNPVLNAFELVWPLPAILVLGNENNGLRPGVVKRCHILVEIPFARHFDSLNVAQAGGILMGLCARSHLNQPIDAKNIGI